MNNYNQGSRNNQGGYRNNNNYDNRNRNEGLDIPLNDFFKENGLVKVEWINDKSQKLAEYLGRNNFKTNQLRNFFHEFLRIKNLNADKDEKEIMIKMLKAKVNYKQGTQNVPPEFKQFINNLVDEMKSDDLFLKRFDNACVLMEALVAYNPK